MLSAKKVVLGLLIGRSGYGYDLQRRVDERFGFLGWSAAVVYKALDRLEVDGHIESTGPKSAGRTRRGSPRNVYRATERGEEAYRRWLEMPSDLALVREEMHVKLVLAKPPDRAVLLEQLDVLHQRCLAELNELRRPPLHELIDDQMPWEQTAGYLVDDAHATRLQGVLDWLERAAAVVEQRFDGHAVLADRRAV